MPSARRKATKSRRDDRKLIIAVFQSARGLADSRTLRIRWAAPDFRQVLDCGGPPPLFVPDDAATERRLRYFTA